MELEVVLSVLSIAMFGATVWAWRWLLRLQRSLKGGEGYELVRIITWIIGLSLVARLIATAGLIAFSLDRRNTDITLVLSIVAQGIGGLIFVGAAIRISQLSTPVDRAGVTVIELQTQSTAQVPRPARDEGASVDDGNHDVLPAPAELD